MKKERDFEVAVGTQDEFWIQAVDLLQAKFVLERLVLNDVYCYSKCFLISSLTQPAVAAGLFKQVWSFCYHQALKG